MPDREEFILYIEAPREQPRLESCMLIGWLKAMQPIEGLKLLDSAEALDLVSRPDVLQVDVGYTNVVGFKGRLENRNLRDGALRFGFSLGGSKREASIPIKAPPDPAKGWTRLRLLFDVTVARWRQNVSFRLGRPMSPSNRWNTEIPLLVAEARLRRGPVVETEVGDQLLEKFAAIFPRATVLHIGANDGVTGDHLSRWFDQTEWQMLLVEPIPLLVEQLKQLYADHPRVKIECAAVSEIDGEASIYRISERPGDPAWFQALASLDRSILVKHRNPISDIEDRIVDELVPILTVRSLLTRHHIDHVDLVVIDTEGHDFKILRQFDLRLVRPIAIVFEHIHLTSEEKKKALVLLNQHSYTWFETEFDIYAWRKFLSIDVLAWVSATALPPK